MAQKTDEQLLIEANEIKDETIQGANTANRVGNMLVDIVDSKINIEGGGGSQTLDQVLAVGNTAYSKQLHIADFADPTQAENIIEYNSIYMYDQDGKEANYLSYDFWIYENIGGAAFFVEGYLDNQNPYLEIYKGDTNNSTKLTSAELIFRKFLDTDYNTISLQPNPTVEGSFQVILPNESGTIGLVDTVRTINTVNDPYQIEYSGTYEIVVASGSNYILFPNPIAFEGKEITLVNTNETHEAQIISNINDNAPYWVGSPNRVVAISDGQMMVFKAIRGKWRGGLIYD